MEIPKIIIPFPVINLFKYLCSVFAAVILLFSCSCNSESTKQEKSNLDSDTVAVQKVQKVFYTVPNPLQATALLKKAGAPYLKDVLNPTSNLSHYSTNFSKAINLGIYGADLAYTNIFNQTQESINYLDAVNKLAVQVGVSTVIEQSEAGSRFQANIGNQDSLMTIIADVFRQADDYFQENKQYNLASLVLTGGWIEGLYIATQITDKKPNKDINDRIAEQKHSLSNLLSILAQSKDEPEFPDLIVGLGQLKKIYDGVTITRIEKEPTTDLDAKVTSINSVSKISMTDEQLREITKSITALRNTITK